MSDDEDDDAALKDWLKSARKNIVALNLRFRQQTHCPKCKRKLDIATRTEGTVVSYIRFCYPCDTLEDDDA